MVRVVVLEGEGVFVTEAAKQVRLPIVWLRGSGGPKGRINCLWGIAGDVAVTLVTQGEVFALVRRLGPGSKVVFLFSSFPVADETMASRLAREWRE